MVARKCEMCALDADALVGSSFASAPGTSLELTDSRPMERLFKRRGPMDEVAHREGGIHAVEVAIRELLCGRSTGWQEVKGRTVFCSV